MTFRRNFQLIFASEFLTKSLRSLRSRILNVRKKNKEIFESKREIQVSWKIFWRKTGFSEIDFGDKDKSDVSD